MLLFDRTPCPPRLEPVVLEGSQVRLEPLSRDHLDDLWVAAASDPRIWTYMPVVVRSRGDLERAVDAALAGQQNGMGMAYAVVDKSTGIAVGSSRYLDYRPADRGVEIGWTWYHVDFWGGPINPESKLLLLRHAFETLGCVRVQLKTDERNARSRAAILKLGARPEGILRQHILVQGNYLRNSAYFSILEDEWPAVEQGLLERLGAGAASSPPASP